MVTISLVKVGEFVNLSSFLFRIYHSKMGVSELMISDCDLFSQAIRTDSDIYYPLTVYNIIDQWICL